MWTVQYHPSDNFVMVSLRHDWQFATDRCITTFNSATGNMESSMVASDAARFCPHIGRMSVNIAKLAK